MRRGTSSTHFHCPVPRSSSHIGHGLASISLLAGAGDGEACWASEASSWEERDWEVGGGCTLKKSGGATPVVESPPRASGRKIAALRFFFPLGIPTGKPLRGPLRGSGIFRGLDWSFPFVVAPPLQLEHWDLDLTLTRRRLNVPFAMKRFPI